MPIVQERLISLIAICDHLIERFRHFNAMLDECARAARERMEADRTLITPFRTFDSEYRALFSLIREQPLTLSDVEKLTEERVHFRHARKANSRNAEYKRRKKLLEAGREYEVPQTITAPAAELDDELISLRAFNETLVEQRETGATPPPTIPNAPPEPDLPLVGDVPPDQLPQPAFMKRRKE